MSSMQVREEGSGKKIKRFKKKIGEVGEKMTWWKKLRTGGIAWRAKEDYKRWDEEEAGKLRPGIIKCEKWQNSVKKKMPSRMTGWQGKPHDGTVLYFLVSKMKMLHIKT